MTSYWFTPRPKSAEHQHPYLVFDGNDRLHLPLILFGKEASHRFPPKTVQTYYYAILPFFTWLDTDVWQLRAGNRWDAPPKQVRQAVEDYLVSKLQCKVQSHRQGWKFVGITAGTQSTLRIFIAALKLFYQIMTSYGSYAFLNPLVEPVSAAAVEARLGQDSHKEAITRMPEQSGVVEPGKRPRHRLSDSYFKLEQEIWKPQIVDDPKLPGLVLEGGRQLTLKHTRQRDEVVTWLLFDTGARVSEVTGLTLGDWAIHGTHQKASAFNKGSNGRRTKVLTFADETVILLRRYFDGERIHFDPNGFTLDDYLLLSKNKQIDLQTIPLFLTTQRSPLSPKEYREHYWNPACQVAGIEADVHQTRHWHVTRAVRDIYETATNEAEVQQRLQSLIEYMQWKSKETLDAYEHYFDQKRHDDTRDAFHQRMHEEIQHYLEERRTGKSQVGADRHEGNKYEKQTKRNMVQDEHQPDLVFLYGLAGEQ